MFEDMILIGENLNATRKVKADGKMVVDFGAGKKGYPYKNSDGEQCHLDLTEALQTEAVQQSGKVGFISWGVQNRDEAFVAAISQNQIRLGADYLDCCIDEISPWPEKRLTHIQWLIQTVQKYVDVPLAIDSSDTNTMRAALDVYDHKAGTPMLNSVNLEEGRMPVLALAREAGCHLLGNASGANSLPSTIEERIENLTKLMALMDEYDIAMDKRTLDPLVLPIGTNPEYGMNFLTTCEKLREQYGQEFHLTGGFSNVSFGLPQRRLLNEAMTYLSREAGCDTAFIDPKQVKKFRPEDEDFKVAITALRGEDMYCMNYINYCRSQASA